LSGAIIYLATNLRRVDMFNRIIKSIQQAQMKRVAYWQLQNLSDKDLKDIGINRNDIRRISYREMP